MMDGSEESIAKILELYSRHLDSLDPAKIPANATQMTESFDGVSIVGAVKLSHDGVFHGTMPGSMPDRSPREIAEIRDDPAVLQAVLEEANGNRVREMHIVVLTPHAPGYPAAPLIAVPAVSSAVNEAHMRDVFDATRARLNNVLEQRKRAGAKWQFTIVFTGFDGAYARLLKPVYMITRQIGNPEIWDLRLAWLRGSRPQRSRRCDRSSCPS